MPSALKHGYWDKKYGYQTKPYAKSSGSGPPSFANSNATISTDSGSGDYTPVNATTSNFGPPGSPTDKSVLERVSRGKIVVCPPGATSPLDDPVPVRLTNVRPTPSLVLNPRYLGPGSPRFGAMHLPNVLPEEQVMALYRAAHKLSHVRNFLLLS